MKCIWWNVLATFPLLFTQSCLLFCWWLWSRILDLWALLLLLVSSLSLLLQRSSPINNHNQWQHLNDDHSCWNNHHYSDYDSHNIIQSNDDSCNIFKGLHQPPNLLDLLDKNMSITLSVNEDAAAENELFLTVCRFETLVAVVIFCERLCPHSKGSTRIKAEIRLVNTL